jgi:hypothetical protein
VTRKVTRSWVEILSPFILHTADTRPEVLVVVLGEDLLDLALPLLYPHT